MVLKEMVKTIDEITKMNKEHTAKTNEALNRIRGGLSTAEYEQGARDAWELARKIVMCVEDGGLTSEELNKCFGDPCHFIIFGENTYEEALAKFKEYEEKKRIPAEQKLECGDVVTCESTTADRKFIFTGVYWHSTEKSHFIINTSLNSISTTEIYKCNWTVTKTGEHIDIQPMYDLLMKREE